MRIKIVGAGWYGCHLALTLQRYGNEIVLVDKVGVFAGASRANQSRLHQGWHYPRSSVTRKCSQQHSNYCRTRRQCKADTPANFFHEQGRWHSGQ